MAGNEAEVSTPLLENIQNQPAALAAIAAYHGGEGRGALERAALLLESKRRIILSGMGASLFSCIPLHYALAAQGKQVTTVETAELLYFLPSLIDSDTAIVLVSRSGESIEVTKLLPLARERGATLIGVVNVPGSTLAGRVDQVIVVQSPADQLVAIQTYTTTVAMFALLAAILADKSDKSPTAELTATVEIMRHWVPTCIAASSKWTDFLTGEWPLYLMGRGSSLGAVSEGVLLMHETAKASAIGMSVPQFRHGPVEVTDTRFRGIVIGTQPDTRDLDASLVEDLTRMQGQVRWLGPKVGNKDLPQLCGWPEGVPDRFRPVIEVVPLQMAAYRKAELRGVHPGDFRWAPLVTDTEAGFSIPS